jgi:hypothetical protein
LVCSPRRDEAWRKRQDELLGDPRLAAQECDCDFSTSGDVVFYSEWVEFLSQTTIKDPLVERRGADQNFGYGNQQTIQEIIW